MKPFLFLLIFLLNYFNGISQPTPFILKGALKENRQQLYRNIINNSITKNLSVNLTDATEEKWQDAFRAMELLYYRSAWTDNKIYNAFDRIQTYSVTFQSALLELAYTNYTGLFFNQAKALLLQTNDPNIFAMCALYILAGENGYKEKDFIEKKLKEKLITIKKNPVLDQLQFQLNKPVLVSTPSFKNLLKKDFLPGSVVLFSFQRSNRNYPGLVIVRDAMGNFITEDNRIFSVPQLARSISGLPAYLTNGNTPEGIFRMDGFDTSASSFIGPTTNIQLTMPFENKAAHFYNDSTLTDSSWDIIRYKNLLPDDLRNYYPLYEAYFAGQAGRTAIIAHGTTVDPAYYKNKSYYPLTPTQGCLCTKEIWNEETGRLKESDQQKLVDAVIKAGGPIGYTIVLNLDDQQKAVEAGEIEELLQSTNHK